MTRRAWVLAALLGASFASGCATPPDSVAPAADFVQSAVASEPEPASSPAAAPAPAIVADAPRLDAHRTLGDAVVVGSLTVWPVLTDAPDDVDAFVALTDAQRRKQAQIRERDTAVPGMSLAERIRERMAVNAAATSARRVVDGASVNELLVDNAGAAPLFIPAGTLVRGGNQDRVLAEDLVVPANSAALARVFCVEPGRWTPVREGAATDGQFEAVECIALREVRSAGQYGNSQTAVWANVSSANAARRATNRGEDGATSLFVSVDGASSTARKDRDAVVDAVLRHFDEIESSGVRPVGFAYAVNGRPVAVRAFAGPRLFRSSFKSFVQAMAMETETARKDGAKPARSEDVVALVRAIDASRKTRADDCGTHRLTYRDAREGWSSACRAPVDGREIVLSEDWTAR